MTPGYKNTMHDSVLNNHTYHFQVIFHWASDNSGLAIITIRQLPSNAPKGAYSDTCQNIKYIPSAKFKGYNTLSATCDGHNTSVTLPKGNFKTYINNFNGNLVVAGWSPAKGGFLKSCSAGKLGPSKSNPGDYTLTETCNKNGSGTSTT